MRPFTFYKAAKHCRSITIPSVLRFDTSTRWRVYRREQTFIGGRGNFRKGLLYEFSGMKRNFIKPVPRNWSSLAYIQDFFLLEDANYIENGGNDIRNNWSFFPNLAQTTIVQSWRVGREKLSIDTQTGGKRQRDFREWYQPVDVNATASRKLLKLFSSRKIYIPLYIYSTEWNRFETKFLSRIARGIKDRRLNWKETLGIF